MKYIGLYQDKDFEKIISKHRQTVATVQKSVHKKSWFKNKKTIAYICPETFIYIASVTIKKMYFYAS